MPHKTTGTSSSFIFGKLTKRLVTSRKRHTVRAKQRFCVGQYAPAKLRVTTNSDMCVLLVPSGSKPAKDSITLHLESQNVRVFVGFEIILTLDRLSAYNA